MDSSGADLATGILGAGQVVFGVLADSLVVAVLTIYFLADLPRIRALLYRFVPHARRPRAILIGDDILAKIGGYVLGNLVISVIAAVLTFIWLLSFGVPYAFLLSVLVALLDLVPGRGVHRCRDHRRPGRTDGVTAGMPADRRILRGLPLLRGLRLGTQTHRPGGR